MDEYITFWVNDEFVPVFSVKRALEKLNKDMADFIRFMEAKHGKAYEIKATEESKPLSATVQMKVKSVTPTAIEGK